MKKYLFLAIFFLCVGCCTTPSFQSVFLDYHLNDQDEPYFSISDASLNHLQERGKTPLLLANPQDLKNLCPSCTSDITHPTIGILLARNDTNTHYELSAEYVYPLIKAGANIRFISYDDIVAQSQNLDGILLPGGAFPSPATWYLSDKKEKFEAPQKRYYAYEYLIKHAQKKRIPLLGICAGMQMMSALLSDEKVKFFDDLEKISVVPHKKLDKYHRAHIITVKQDTTLHHILQTDILPVNSRHKMGLAFHTTQNVPDIIPAALAQDDVVEAVEFSTFPTALGVQFHPEVFAMQNDESAQRIFSWFVNNANNYHLKKE